MKTKKILSFICCLPLLLLMTGCGNKDDSEKYNIVVNAPEELEVKTFISTISRMKQVLVSVTNKDDRTIGRGYIDISYYDENNEKIDPYDIDDIRYELLESGKEIVYGFNLPAPDDMGNYIPAKIQINVTIDEKYQEQFSDEISEYEEAFLYSYSINNDVATLSLKNNTSYATTAHRSMTVVYYKKNRPIFSSNKMFIFKIVESGKTTSWEDTIPLDDEKSNEAEEPILIDFDDIKMFKIVR